MSNGFHKISYQDAKDQILGFLFQSDLYIIAANNAFGGTLLKETFEPQIRTTYPGTLGWYCFNYEVEPLYPDFFIAFETSEYNYDASSPPPTAIKSSPLYYTNNIFTYNFAATSANVDFFLKNQIQICNGLLPIDYSDATRLKNFFRNNFPSGGSNPHNRYDCAFFEKTALIQFINQGPYVRYYFGYDSNPAQEQKIRLILFSVDASGKNILVNPGDPTKDAIILERHWPPT